MSSVVGIIMTHRLSLPLVFLVLLGFVAPLAGSLQAAAPPFVVLPRSVALDGREARQSLVVQRIAPTDPSRLLGQIREGIEITSDDERVARVEQGVVVPVADGKTRIVARVEGQVVSTDVVVVGQSRPFQWSFRNHVESVLSKTGCNGGACHGARAGKNGFRLTLFGFDLDADYSYLTRQANGRRIVPTDPGRSLLLTKPTGQIAHKGGVRFEPDSLEYRVLAEWIAAGTPGPSASDPLFARLEVLPKATRQRVGDSQQLIVLAHFNDGRVEDVTRWAKYTSTNSTVATVGEQGRVELIGSGEGAIKVWYLNYNEMAFLSVPYPGETDERLFAASPRHNFLDEQIDAKLRSLNLPPSPPADDGAFFRRAHLDTIGVLPTLEETREFLADRSPDKRERAIERLLARPEFVDYWSYKWSDLLLLSGERLRPKALEAYYQWLRGEVARNTPWDRLVRSVIVASGSTYENGAANFYALHQDPEDMAETVAQAFLGLSINCARCHNHPLEKWTNDQYYGFANMFSRVRSKGWGGDFRSGDGLRVVFSDVQGELLQPGKGRPQPPRPLDGEPLPMEATADRRIALADWLTSSENPYFTRTIVNRVWANFFGVGLVEKVDDLRITNPASNELLLDAVARHLIDQRFDLKQLMRTILRSAAYQRDSRTLPGNAADERFYARYYPRRLKAELLLDAISHVADAPTQFQQADKKPYPTGTRALQLPDAAVNSYFLSTFGRPERLITCDCERSDEPSMAQVLHLSNGDTINAKLRASGSRVARQLAAGMSDEEIVETLYLTAFCRLPAPDERTRLLAVLSETPAAERAAAIEDLYWSVMTSREFLFNH